MIGWGQALRACSQATTSRVRVSASGMRRSRHYRLRTLSSIAAMVGGAVAAIIASGVNQDGRREILGLGLGDSEARVF